METTAAAPSVPAPNGSGKSAAVFQQHPPLTGSTKWLGTFALSMATFMNVLDTSIANVSIPAISGDLGVSTSQGTWVITSFAVANAIAVPLTGWLTQRFGQVRLFTLSILLFALASLLCGLAPNLQTLIAFRILQGAMAGPMIPLSQSLLLSSFPKAKAGTALAVWSITTLVAPVMGPIVGGAITDNYSWPWIFYINVPIGLVTAWITWTIYRSRETATKKLPVDIVGLGLLVVWVSSMQIMLDKGKELDWFHSREIVGLALIAVTGFSIFLIWELIDNDHPIVDLKLFKRRNFLYGVIAMSVGYGAYFGSVVIFPLWLQTQMGYTATWAGWMTAPVGILAVFLSPVIGKNLHRVDLRLLACGSFLIFALTSFMRSDFNTQIDPFHLVIPTIIQGAATALFFIPLVSLIISGLAPDRIPAATGLSNFVRITFGAIGTSVVTTLWDNRSALHRVQLTQSLTAYSANTDQAISAMSAAGLSNDQAMLNLERMVEQQAHMLGANDLFWISGVIFLILAGLIWLAKPEKSAAPVDVSAAAH
jgi:DHA2 family multidrug resistance protein